MQYIACALIIVHGILLLWSIGGFLEMMLAKVPWKPFTNPDFPNWILLIHWSSVLFASAGFLYGYFSQWSKTPQIMAVAYGLMAMVCVIETFGYMTSKTEYLAMGAEILTYTVILLLLFKSKYFTEYFNYLSFAVTWCLLSEYNLETNEAAATRRTALLIKFRSDLRMYL